MTNSLIEALDILAMGRGLTAEQSHAALTEIMQGEATETIIASLLTALRVKGETAEELAGAVGAVRDRMTVLEGPFPLLLDTCGTGGDGARSVNISTATAIVAAACGAPVAKHGNRSASGNSGSAEVLSALGIAIEAEPTVLRRCLNEAGITFLYAPRFHPALRFAAPARKQLPFRTLFNLIGPLANPARPDFQLVGVPDERQAALMAEAIVRLGTRRAAVVTGGDGLDEVTLAGMTSVRWVEAGRISLEEWAPGDFGLPRVEVESLRVDGPADSADRLRRLFDGEHGPIRNVVLANVAAALRVAGRFETLREGVEHAEEVIDAGSVARTLDLWRRISQG